VPHITPAKRYAPQPGWPSNLGCPLGLAHIHESGVKGPSEASGWPLAKKCGYVPLRSGENLDAMLSTNPPSARVSAVRLAEASDTEEVL